MPNPIESRWNDHILPLVRNYSSVPLSDQDADNIRQQINPDFPLALATAIQQQKDQEILSKRVERIEHNKGRLAFLMPWYQLTALYVGSAADKSVNAVAAANKSAENVGMPLMDEVAQAEFHIEIAHIRHLYENDSKGFSVINFVLEEPRFSERIRPQPFAEIIRSLVMIGADRYKLLYNQLSH